MLLTLLRYFIFIISLTNFNLEIDLQIKTQYRMQYRNRDLNWQYDI